MAGHESDRHYCGALHIPVGRHVFLLLHYYEYAYKTSDRKGTEDEERRSKQLLDERKEKRERVLIIARGNTRSHCVENCLCKMLWSCRNTDYRMN